MSLPNTETTAKSLRRVFHDGFVARDLAEPLLSFDSHTELDHIRVAMTEKSLKVVGVRENGVINGFVEFTSLVDDQVTSQIKPLSDAGIVLTTSPLREVIACLDESNVVLVETLGHPVGVIMRDDLEKAPMRMWLFGMVTLFEMRLTRLLADHHEADSWTDHLTEARVAKAKQLQDERLRRKEQVALLDCLQLSDKGQLFAKSETLRTQHWNRSKTQILKVVREIEALRNNLAHSQPFITRNWEVITRIPEAMDSLLNLPHQILTAAPAGNGTDVTAPEESGND